MEKRTPDNTKIKMYTTSWCGPCKMAKKFLAEKGYNFEEVDIEEIIYLEKRWLQCQKDILSLKF